MVAKIRALTDTDFIAIGKRHGSDAVGLEWHDAQDRWQTYVGVLATYGMGQQSLDAFKELCAQHTSARNARPEAVAAKAISVKDRDAVIERGWEWAEQVHSALSGPAQRDQALADKLNAAYPTDSATIDAGINALLTLLQTHRAGLDPDFPAEELIARAPALAEQIRSLTAATTAAKAAPKQDTQAIDLLDGKIVTIIARLNRAGRKAFGRAQDKATRDLFRFKHVAHTRNAAAPKPAPTGSTPTA